MAYSCISFFLLFCCCSKSLYLVWCCECLERFSMLVRIGMCGCCREIVARSDNLAQASLSRLGEMSRDSPRPFHARSRPSDQLSFERVNISLRRGESRLSENAHRLLFLCVELLPRRRELAWARDPLAWARPFSLSKALGESAFWFGVSLVLECLACIWLDYYIMAWEEWICMTESICERYSWSIGERWFRCIVYLDWTSCVN